MGGPGSGLRWGPGRNTVGSCRSIDVRRWQRDGLLRPGIWFGWSWWRDEERKDKAASIGVWVHQDRVTLEYRHQGPGDTEWHEVTETVPLTWTPCNYGGRRPWFLCPGVMNGMHCGCRVALLYAGGRHFLCRHCYRLAYQSTREEHRDRMLRKAQAIRERLGGSGNMMSPFPWKPKGMHWRTYSNLWKEAREAEEAYTEALHLTLQKMRKMLGRRPG